MSRPRRLSSFQRSRMSRPRPGSSGWSRREVLGLVGGVGATAFVAGCGGFGGSGDDAVEGELTFTTWGTDAELQGFERTIAGWSDANPGASVRLNAVPFAQMFENIDAQLQSNTAPDIFRVDYDNLGTYAGRGQLLDMSSFFDDEFGGRFSEAMWQAVKFDGNPYGVPHHTDTSLILYNTRMMTEAGITDIPTTIENAWSWDEFEAVAATLRGQLPDDQYPFVYNWQASGVTRWLSWLFQSDGRFLAEDLVTPAIDSDAGRAAVDFTKSFFDKQFVPPNSSTKSTTFANEFWYAENTAMTFAGAFLLPDADAVLDWEWGATYSPQNVRGGGDLGGNSLVVTANTEQGELAASFLRFATEQEPMRDFCAASSLLPTRRDLIASGIDLLARPELGRFFLEQATTVQPSDAEQVASASMAEINLVLSDELEQAFVGGQSTDDTLANITAGIAEATAR